jgi:hypothetical protein
MKDKQLLVEQNLSQGFSMLGASLGWVRTMDHSITALNAAEHGTLHCGAVAIGCERDVLVLRSSLRCRWLNRAMALSEIYLAAPMMMNRYELDQWEWIMCNTYDPLSRTGVAAWYHYSNTRPGIVTQFVCAGNSLRLQLNSGEALHICLRPDLDATLVVSSQPDTLPSPSTIVIGEPQHLYGWLRPDGAYRVFWNARSWANAEAAWLWGRRHLTPPQSQALFKAIYRQMLEQHPSLQRRLAAIQHPIMWAARPDIGVLIEEIRQETRGTKTHVDRVSAA